MSAIAPFAAAFAVMLISLVGVIFTANTLSRWMHKHLAYLATFSAGVFIVVVYHLLEEALHESGSIALVAGAVLLGAALIEATHHLFPAHHHHDTEHDHTHSRIDGRRVLASDALHNIGDGVLLVAAFATDWYVGLAATVGILLHELVQEVSEFFVLKEAGYTTTQALVRNFATSATILIGVGLALLFASAEPVVAFLAGLAAGGFLTLIVRDLLPHAVSSSRRHKSGGKHMLALFLGLGIMVAVQFALPHEHAHDEHDHAHAAGESHDHDDHDHEDAHVD